MKIVTMMVLLTDMKKMIQYRELKGDWVHAKAKDTKWGGKERNPNAHVTWYQSMQIWLCDKKHVTETHELSDEDAKDAGDPIEQLRHLLHPPKPGRVDLYLYLLLFAFVFVCVLVFVFACYLNIL